VNRCGILDRQTAAEHASRTEAREKNSGTPGVTADVRCLIVGLSMGSVPGAAPRTAGVMIAMYYLGRLDARSPKPDLEALLGEEVEKITPNDLKSESVRCGTEFKSKGNQLAKIGRRHMEREQKQKLEKKQELEKKQQKQ
jgi:hypothetical protein